ncbi:Imm21 family immunity protein [Pelosinus sp. IPA-1]|uniref:Imm21 family immunity protein n=1 Tax=Pelosinus sp. IPA-1 TaxID=3029569 RepID=UPI00243622A9|nr:Imm21 family immunity protein [Pelosinus sp. IPA-1]GMA98779.1 hypothetical protein PIPA1_15790 [Pelosinus sp. IPA-1]
MNKREIIKWIECDGGPHLLLEKRLVPHWMGTTDIQDDDKATDYDRACNIEDYIGIIPVSNGCGLVVSEDVAKSTWIASEDGNGGFLVVLNYIGDDVDESLIVNKIRTVDRSLFEATNLQFSVQDNYVYLFAACDCGPEWLYGCAEIQLKPGIYSIDTIDSYDFDECSFRIHRLRRS